VQAKTHEGALARVAEAIAEGVKQRGGVTRFGTSTTVAEFGAWWLDTEARRRVRSSSLDRMAQRVGRLGSVGSRPLAEVTTEELMAWQSALLDTYAPKTVADTRTTVRQLFAAASELKLIAANPVERLKPPKPPKSAGRTLTVDEVRALLHATDAHRYGPVVRILFTTGLRVSEALGLSWDDVNLVTGRTIVRRAVTYSAAHGTKLGPPKTQGAIGAHHLAPGVVTTTCLLARTASRRKVERRHALAHPALRR
jgi:integrase